MVPGGQRSCSIVNPKSTIRNPKSAQRAAAPFQNPKQNNLVYINRNGAGSNTGVINIANLIAYD